MGDSEAPAADGGAIAFAEKALAMLDQGSFTATYKYALVLALVDVCLEGADEHGRAPARVHPRKLAERVIELYWPHTSPYGSAPAAVVLRQNRGGQIEVVQMIARFREGAEAAGCTSLASARRTAPERFDRLVGDVTWKLVEMPLPRLQWFGRVESRFIYDIGWDRHVSRGRFERGEVDPYLRLRPGAGDHLVRLAGLLRPLVQRQWAAQVIALNRRQLPALEQHDDLDRFLFGATRVSLEPVRADLRDLQERTCLYCGDRLRSNAEVDHFLPWSRHPDDGIHNLVVAHRGCNNRKRDFLAAATHVSAWARRFHDQRLDRDLGEIAAARRWPHHPRRTLSVARALYLRLPSDARLWQASGDFTVPDRPRLAAALASDLHTLAGDEASRTAIRPAAEAPTAYDPDPSRRGPASPG